MKVTYLYHSGFSVELEKNVLVFDYYKGQIPEFSKDKRIIFFVSHKHQDHFNPEIFEFVEKYPNVEFFLGSDIHLSEKYMDRIQVNQKARDHIHSIGKNKQVNWEDLKIETLRSTDAGVAFIIQIEHKSLYHAGDLNWWNWSLETKEYNHNMEALYKKEIDQLKGRSFHLAFLVLDPRQEEAMCWGMEYFLEQTKTNVVFPMHMFEKYDKIQEVKLNNMKKWPDVQLMETKYNGQEFALWN